MNHTIPFNPIQGERHKSSQFKLGHEDSFIFPIRGVLSFVQHSVGTLHINMVICSPAEGHGDSVMPIPRLPPSWMEQAWCDRQLPRGERTPFIRTDFSATLPVCFDDQGSHTNPLRLQAGYRCSPLRNKCTGVQTQPRGLNTHQLPPCHCQICSWEVLSYGNSFALL